MFPIGLYREAEERYKRYLKTTFYFKDSELREQFKAALDSGHLSKGPYIEATPVFKRGEETGSLFKSLLSDSPDPGFLKALEKERRLYFHQQQAIEKVFKDSKNVVVATGTASGKTESFLYPVLLHLYQEWQKSQLGTGVRALILYPMNALANDQRARLGEICKNLWENNSPFSFTFGQYIGDTPEDKSDSRRKADVHINNRLHGELVLREEMRENPPHILLTNFSMLEYLLIRPQDTPLFDNNRAQSWTFLVIDEAHQYRGSKGIELGMLIRRLKQRLREGGQNKPFKCIATSATIARGEKDRSKVAQFASDLFGEIFSKENVIFGREDPLPKTGKLNLNYDTYTQLHKEVESGSHQNIDNIASELGIAFPQGIKPEEKLGFILKNDKRVAEFRNSITTGPKRVDKLVCDFFPDISKEKALKVFSDLVTLLVRAIDTSKKTPLLSSRYHLFLRSLEGAFLSYYPQKQLYLDRHSQDNKGAVFEIALCRECGQHYLVGRYSSNGMMLQEAIRDPGHPDFGATFFRPIENREEKDIIKNTGNNTLFQLCIRCSHLSQLTQKKVPLSCGHKESILVEKQKGAEEREDQIPQCSACGYRGPDPVREVIHGTDGPHSVIATTLYQKLPLNRKKILAFSDGRQEAAFFAWYLEQSYKDILNRNLFLKVIRALNPGSDEGLSLHEIAEELSSYYINNKMFSPSTGKIHPLREAWSSVYREFLSDQTRISLEGVGLIMWRVKLPDQFIVPEILFSSPWQLDQKGALNLIYILLNFMRLDKAVELRSGDRVTINWNDLNLQSFQKKVKIGPPKNKKYKSSIISWQGKTGKRSGFLAKLLENKGIKEKDAASIVDNTLCEIWQSLKQCGNSLNHEDKILLSVDDACRLNPDWWRAFPITQLDDLFQCTTCARIQPFSVNDLCIRHNCPGTVNKVTISDLEKDHYNILYQEELPGSLKVEEHTAQISTEKAWAFQKDFKSGNINVLSSSTTFELGVDLGELDVIFLRNVPPETFNYAQRVGRAGRRVGFPGFALTYCRRSPHDLYHFAAPDKRILKGIVRPPIISLNNEKIIMRHIMANALSCFFRKFPERFESVESLLGDLERPCGVRHFADFLEENHKELACSLKSIIPKNIQKTIGLENKDWIKRLVDSQSRFLLAQVETSNDYIKIKDFEHKSLKNREYRKAEWAKKREETIQRENILSFLSRKAIIPKYGFPVDVVELDTQRLQGNYESSSITLQRDLSIAISEFAPTSKLVANKKEWESYSIKKVIGKELPTFNYRLCPHHNYFQRWNEGDIESSDICCRNARNGKYLIPLFGFMTNNQGSKKPTGRTHRVFSTRPYFIGLRDKGSGIIECGQIQLTKTSPGYMVVICEGRKGEGFFICDQCGAGFRERKSTHNTPYGEKCSGALDQVSLGHEFLTDILQIRFLTKQQVKFNPIWFGFSLAYAIVEGAAEVLEVPTNDLNATVTFEPGCPIAPLVLYDNVPGGAGLVARLEDKSILLHCLQAALERVSGECGCGEEESCYGCLRSYRNQFAHQNLNRGVVKEFLSNIIKNRKY